MLLWLCLVENDPVVLKTKTFKYHSWISFISLLYPLGKHMDGHLNKLRFFYIMMYFVTFGWNWPSDYGEEEKIVKFYRHREQAN